MAEYTSRLITDRVVRLAVLEVFSAESVGLLRLRKLAHCVIDGRFDLQVCNAEVSNPG